MIVNFLEKLQEIFPTKQQQNDQEKQLAQQKERELNRKVSEVSVLADSLEQQCSATRKTAHNLLKAGKRNLAEEKMTELRILEIAWCRQRKKSFLINHYRRQIEIAKVDTDLAVAFAGFVKMVKFEPPKIENMFAIIDKVVNEKADIDSMYESVYREETKKGSVAFSASVPSFEEMMSELENEVALEVGGGKTVATNDSGAIASAKEKLAKVREQGGQS